MTDQVRIAIPVELPSSLLKAIREHPTTSHEDRDEMNQRIGWLLCAWDVIVETHGTTPAAPLAHKEAP